MKKYLLALAMLFTVPAVQAADVGVSVSIGQPGFYGQLDIGDYYPRPQVIYTQPRVVHVVPYEVRPAPLYLRVPPGHAKHWSKFCDRYDACDRPVYFVQDSWYNQVYVPRYRTYYERGDDGRRYDRDYWEKHGYKHDRDDHGGRWDDRGGRGDRDDDHDHGPGNGKGHGHGKDKH